MQPISFAGVDNQYRVNPVRSQYANRNKGYEKERMSFGSRTESSVEQQRKLNESYAKAVAIANLKDRQLLDIAKANASKDDKYKMNTYTAALMGIPVADTLIRGAFSDAPKLAGKLGTMGKVAAGWAGVIALAGIYNGLFDKISAVVPVLKRSEDRHPVMNTLLRLAGFAAVIVGAQKGASKIAEVFPKMLPGLTKDFGKIKKSVAKAVNNSFISKKITSPLAEKISNFATKHPKFAKGGVTALVLSVPFLAFGALFKAITDKAEKSDKVRDTYNQLAQARAHNREVLNNIQSGIFMERLEREIAKAANGEDGNISSEKGSSLNEIA